VEAGVAALMVRACMLLDMSRLKDAKARHQQVRKKRSGFSTFTFMSKSVVESPRIRNIKPKSQQPVEISTNALGMRPNRNHHLSPPADLPRRENSKVEMHLKSPRSPPVVSSAISRESSNTGIGVNASGIGMLSARRSSQASNSTGIVASTTFDMGLAVSNHMLSISLEKSVSSVASACAHGFSLWLSFQVIRVIGFDREKSSDRLFLLAACGENCSTPLTTRSDLPKTDPQCLQNAGLAYKAAKSGLCIKSTCDSSDVCVTVDIGDTFSPISGQIIAVPCLHNDACVAVLTATASSFSDSEYIMFQQIAKLTGISIANSISHQSASSIPRQCSLIQRASAILLRSRNAKILSDQIDGQDSQYSDDDFETEKKDRPVHQFAKPSIHEAAYLPALSNMVIATAMLAKQLALAKESIVYIVDDKKHILYTWKSPTNLCEPEDALHSGVTPIEVKVSSSKAFIDMISHSKVIYSNNTSKDSLFETDALRAFISPPSEFSISCVESNGSVNHQQYSTMLIGISCTSADIFGSSDVSTSSNTDHTKETTVDEGSVAVIIQIYDRAEVFGQKRHYESLKCILEELGKILINALTFESSTQMSKSLDDGLLELASCTRKDEVFASASEMISSSLAVDWAAIYEVSDSGSFVWNGKASQNVPQSLGVGQHRKEILIGEAPVATYVINNSIPHVKPKFSQKGKGPVRIIRMGEQDYDDKRQRRLSGETDRGMHPMMEAIKSGGPVHIPVTMLDLKILPQDFDGKKFNGFKCTAVLACPCFDEAGNVVAVAVAGNKRLGGWCRSGDMKFSVADVALLQKISQHAGIAFSKARLFESFQFQQLYWFKLLELCQIIASTRDTTKIMDIVQELAPKSLGCERAVLFFRVPTEKELWTVLKPNDTTMELSDSNLTFEQRVYLAAKRKAESAQLQALSEETYLDEFLKSIPVEVQSIFCRSLPLSTGLHDVPSGISAEKVFSAANSASRVMSSHSGREVCVKYSNSIAGIAADTARIVNLRGPGAYAEFLNPSTDCIYRPVGGPSSSSQKVEQELPKNIMAVPIFSGSSPRDVIGVLQLVNKIDIEQSHFTLSATGDPVSFGLTATSAWQTLARPGKLTSSTQSMRFLKTLVGLESKRMMDESKTTEPTSRTNPSSDAASKRKYERQLEKDERQLAEEGDTPDKKSFNAGDAAVATYLSASISSSFQHGFALQKRFAVEEELRSIINVYGAAIRSSQELSSTTNLSELLQKLSKQLRLMVQATQVTVHMKSSARNDFDVYHLVGSCVSEIFKHETSAISGIIGHVFSSEKPLNCPRAFEHPCFDKAIDERPNLPIYSLVAWPITTQFGKVIGVLSCGNKSVVVKKKDFEEIDVPGSITAIESKMLDCDEDIAAVDESADDADESGQKWSRFTYMDEKLISVIADELGVAFLNIDRYNRINKLHVTLKELHSEVHLSKLMKKIGSVISKTFRASSANIFMKDADTGQSFWTEMDLSVSGVFSRCIVPLGRGLVGHCASVGDVINVPDSSKATHLLWGCYSGSNLAESKYPESLVGVQNAIAIPIKDNVGSVFAVLQLVDCDGPEGFSSDDISLLQIFCSHASLTLKQCIKHDDLTTSLESTRLILKCTSSLVGCLTENDLGNLATTTILSIMPCKEPTLLVLDAAEPETWLKYECSGEPKRARFTGIAAHVVTSGDVINTSSSKDMMMRDQNVSNEKMSLSDLIQFITSHNNFQCSPMRLQPAGFQLQLQARRCPAKKTKNWM
jgi:GAF domain-containing protein